MPLTIVVPRLSCYDEETREFFPLKDTTLKMEHSLVSISKWESKWRKPFFSGKDNDKNANELRDYFRCMCITQNVDPRIFHNGLGPQNEMAIAKYIEEKPTATTIRETNTKKMGRPVTSELIYYWLFSYGIDKECEKWNIHRLLMLIRVFNEENSPSGKMDAKSREALNAQRIAQSKMKKLRR